MKISYQRNSAVELPTKKKHVTKISLCTTCMDRLPHLEKTLVHNLKEAEGMNVELVVVNYNSSDNLDAWIVPYRDRVVYHKTPHPYLFNQSHAKNCAHRLATGDILINIDADNFVTKEYLAFILNTFNEEGPNNVIVRSDGIDKEVADVKGRIAISRENFYKLGGYDESFYQRGLQDHDLLRRATLLLGLKKIQTKIGSLYLEHSHGDRIRNCPIGESIYVEHINAKKCVENIDNRKLNPNGDNWGRLDRTFPEDADIISHKNAKKIAISVTTETVDETADIGVIFLYHKVDNTTITNYNILKKNNPNVPIICLNNGKESLGVENDVFTNDCGEYAKIWKSITLEPALQWRNGDLPYMCWYSSNKRKLNCKHWVFIEYDTYVNMSLVDYIEPNKGLDVVATSVFKKETHPDWNWWKEHSRLPPWAQGKNLTGVSPMTGVIVSDKAMSQMSQFYLKHVRNDVFAELRFASVATTLGFAPVPNRHPLAKNVRYEKHPEGNVALEYGICHPAKD